MNVFCMAVILAFQGAVFFALGALAERISGGLPELITALIDNGMFAISLVVIIGAAVLWAIFEALNDGTRLRDPHDWDDTQ